MKSKILILIAVVAFAFTSCEEAFNNVTPEGEKTTQTYEITDLDGLSIADAFSAIIVISDQEKVMIETNQNLHQYIRMRESGNHLSIDVYGANIRGNATLNAIIYTQSLSYIEGSGASNIYTSDSISGRDLLVELSGASKFASNINVNQLDVELSGASTINLGGMADEVVVEFSGASSLSGFDFQTKYLNAELSGASTVRAIIHQELRVEASGASNVYYKGDAVIGKSDLSGGSHIYEVKE